MSTTTQEVAIFDRAQAIAPELIEIRRRIHAHPELSFHENETAKYVAETLQKLGYSPKFVAGGLGVVAEIGPSAAPLVAIRADMDALPIEETNQVDYCSQAKGTMHACGHDAHTACALGAAKLLAAAQSAGELRSRVRFVFQPAEEMVNDEGKSGATLVIEDGALDGVSIALGLHVYPGLPVGAIALKPGPLLAACDTFEINVKGSGTHAAFPELGVDAIVLASHVVQAVQTIISRRKSALEPAVITLGGIRSTTYRSNIVAEEVQIVGTARYFRADLIDTLREELTNCCKIAEALGGSFDLKYVHDNPVLSNDPQAFELMRDAAVKVVGAKGVIDAPMEMGAEDFSFIAKAVPSCFAILGTEIANDTRKLHTPTFDIDERALPIGAALLAQSALDFGNQER